MKEKKSYEKPAVVYREKIEARAGNCTKIGTSQPSCGTGPFIS